MKRCVDVARPGRASAARLSTTEVGHNRHPHSQDLVLFGAGHQRVLHWDVRQSTQHIQRHPVLRAPQSGLARGSTSQSAAATRSEAEGSWTAAMPRRPAVVSLRSGRPV